jgi:hypothetical protein
MSYPFDVIRKTQKTSAQSKIAMAEYDNHRRAIRVAAKSLIPDFGLPIPLDDADGRREFRGQLDWIDLTNWRAQ